MRLDQELVRRGLCESRTEAQELISKGCVFVDGNVTTKQTKNIEEGDAVEVTGRRQYVSRGGEKLAGAFSFLFDRRESSSKFPSSHFQFRNEHLNSEEKIRTPARRHLVEQGVSLLAGKVALDVGSSTGGFTDYLLQHGVAHVDAVDVGTGQLHASLQRDSRVTSYENTDIRSFTSTSTYDVIVVDLSFIKLEQVVDSLLKHAHSGTLCFFLIKPQFEVGKGNTKKGIVKEKELVNEVLEKYSVLACEKGLGDVRIAPCVIQGGDGNQEYFLTGVKK